MRRIVITAMTACVPIFALATAHAQTPAPVPRPPAFLPRLSPYASLSQTIGMTEIALTFGRPGVKGRKIWGGLVPYGEVWRSGANENTTIRFSTPVKIEGHELPPGIYGLHAIPGEQDWTIIFSKDSDKWGSFEYKQESDALRVQVKPRPADFQELLTFEIAQLSNSAGEVALHWEKLAVPFKVEFDTPRLVMEKARADLGPQQLFQVANYCYQSSTCLEEGERWVEASISLDPNFWNYRLKARLLAKRNDLSGAVVAAEKALVFAKQMESPPPSNSVTDLEKTIAEWKKQRVGK